MSILDEHPLIFVEYLSKESQEEFINSLKAFLRSNRINSTPFTNHQNKFFLQGDIVKDPPFPYFKDGAYHTKTGIKGVILSNTCDMSSENTRLISNKYVIAPLISIKKIKIFLEKTGVDASKIQGYVDSIINYRKTETFFLPIDENGNFAPDEDGYYADFNSIFHLDIDIIDTINNHVISMNQFMHYLFLFKISYHFCRLQEKGDRSKNDWH